MSFRHLSSPFVERLSLPSHHSFSFLFVTRCPKVCMLSTLYQRPFSLPGHRSLSLPPWHWNFFSLLQCILGAWCSLPSIESLSFLNHHSFFLFPLGVEAFFFPSIEILCLLFVATHLEGACILPFIKSLFLFLAIIFFFLLFVTTHPKGALSFCFLFNVTHPRGASILPFTKSPFLSGHHSTLSTTLCEFIARRFFVSSLSFILCSLITSTIFLSITFWHKICKYSLEVTT